VVRDAVVSWQVKARNRMREGPKDGFWSLPVVAETFDGYLNDINGFHVKEEHAFQALDNARSGPVEEGNVGGGTGMVCFQFKGGIGTASRKLDANEGSYTVGVLSQCNFGRRPQLLIAGVPVGREIPEDLPATVPLAGVGSGDTGSIIIVVATDAPLLPHQLKRLARRAAMGLARTGGTAGNSSGDIFIAFSTANPGAAGEPMANVQTLNNNLVTPLFDATVQATEESIINALVAAETMVGRDHHRVVALPHVRLREVLGKYNRLASQP
jgi:L-aminopeptidase/D-esterase-like protein